MQHIVVTVVMICIGAVSGGHRCGNAQVCGPTQCGPLERPVHGSPRRDRFCRPLFTPPWELWKLRSCVCKRRFLRNSWGECIPRLKCIPCKFKWQRDYRTCAPGCPATCHETFRTSCNIPCTDGCVCPPGWVVHPKYPRKCVKAHKCLPRCPPHSSYQACVSTCLPKCGQTPPTKCHVNCERGACICKKGYLESERNGKKTCVLQALCPWNNRTTHLFSPNATEHTGTIEGSVISRAFISDTESVPGQPEHAGHGSTIPRVPTNVTSTHLLGTSSENSGHGAVTSSEGSESLLSGGGRIGSAGLDTRLEKPIGTGRHVLIGISRNTEVAVASGSSGFEEATGGVYSNGAPRSSPERVVESVMASVNAGSLPNSRPTVTPASSGVGKATIGVPSGGQLNSGTTGIPSIPATDTESARENTRLSIPRNTGSAASSGFSEVSEAASGAPSSNTMQQDSASSTSTFVELAGGNVFRGNLRNGMVPGTASSSRVAEDTLRATSTGTVPPSLTSTTGLIFRPEEIRAHISGTTSISTTGTSAGSLRLVNPPQGVIRQPGSSSEPIDTHVTNGGGTGVEVPRTLNTAGNIIVPVTESAGSVIGEGSTGGIDHVGDSIGVTHSTSNRENIHVSSPRNAVSTDGSGFSRLHTAAVGLPSDSALNDGLAHIGHSMVVPRPIIGGHTSEDTPISSANVAANSNSSGILSGNVGSAASGSIPHAAGAPSQTNLGSSTYYSVSTINSGETRSTFDGTVRENALPGGSVTHRRPVATGVTHGELRPLTTSIGITVNMPEVTFPMVRRESPTSITLTGSSTMVPLISAQRNKLSLRVPSDANTSSNTAEKFGTIVPESSSRNMYSPVVTTYLSRNSPTRIFTSTAGETSSGTNTHLRRTFLLTGTTPSATVNLSRGRGAMSEGLPLTPTGNILLPINEGAASASMVSAASGIHAGSMAPRGVVPVSSVTNREELSPGAVSSENSVSTIMTSAPGPTGAIPTSGSLTGVRVSTGEGAAVSNATTIPTSGTASSLPLQTESIAGTPTGAPRSISASISGTTDLDGIPTVPSATELKNILALLSHRSSSATPYFSELTNTREAMNSYDAMPSESMPVGAETILRALGNSARKR